MLAKVQDMLNAALLLSSRVCLFVSVLKKENIFLLWEHTDLRLSGCHGRNAARFFPLYMRRKTSSG